MAFNPMHVPVDVGVVAGDDGGEDVDGVAEGGKLLGEFLVCLGVSREHGHYVIILVVFCASFLLMAICR